MKLVDILAEKWTVWPYPEDAFVSQDVDKDACAFLSGDQTYNSYGNWNGDSYVSNSLIPLQKIATDQRTAVITRAQWQAAVDALKAEAVPAWTGDGYPPVGTLCEYRNTESGVWGECEIVAFRKGAWVVFDSDCETDFVTLESLRPRRTPEQIAAEAREKAIEEMVEFFVNYYGNPKGSEQYLLICRSLHDAGYRKLEIVDKDDGEAV